MHTRQVAHAARYHHEALVLDRPGLSTHTNPRVTVLRIRKERHEEDLHPLVGHDTGKLREFHVITDQHADPGAIRIKRLHHLPTRESPALLLVRGDMYLLVHLVGAVTTDQVSHVIQRPVLLQQRHATGDDIDIVDGGSKDFIFTDSADSSFEYTLSADLSEDINEIHLGGGNDQYTGGIGIDKVWSGSGNDEISTGVGNDIVYTNDSSDKNDNNKIYLGAGSDEFYGGDGIDIVNGGSEDAATDENTIKLGGGNDEYYGGSGVDKVWAGSGDDNINTRAGDDEVYTTDGSSNDENTIDLGAGSDHFEGGNGKDFVYGGYDDASGDINTANLGGGDDRYYGSIGKDIVHGGADDDYIWGEDGNNELYGDAGNDYLYGGADNDKLYGGTGRDYFYPEKGTNRIDCGTDNNTDVVMINNDAGGVDTIYNVSARDIISCSGGFNLETLQQIGNDVIIYGYGGNQVIFKNVKLPEEDEPENPDSNIPAENMPVLYQPDGSVLQWNGA